MLCLFLNLLNFDSDDETYSLYIAGDRTKMVGNRSPRQVLSVYQRLRPPDGGEGTSLPPAMRAGPGCPSTGRGRGRGRGRPRRDPLLPRLSTSRRTRLLPRRTTWRPRAQPQTLRRGTRGLSRRRTVLLSRLPTCEVPQAFLRFRFLTDVHWFVLWEEGK